MKEAIDEEDKVRLFYTDLYWMGRVAELGNVQGMVNIGLALIQDFFKQGQSTAFSPYTIGKVLAQKVRSTEIPEAINAVENMSEPFVDQAKGICVVCRKEGSIELKSCSQW